MASEYKTSYQVKWGGDLPTMPPSVSERNWQIFNQHVKEGRSMYWIAAEHHITRARVSAIISRVDQLLLLNDSVEERAAAPVLAVQPSWSHPG